MKLHIKYTFSYIMILAVCLTSCEDYLDEAPSKSSGLIVKNTTELDALLDDYLTMGREVDGFQRLYLTDDFDFLPEYHTSAALFYGQLRAAYAAFWDRQYLQTASSRDWSDLWSKVFTANLVLTSLENVEGTEEDKSRLKAEAHFIRAYNYWVLVNSYCLPYTNANGNEMGLPSKLNTSFEEDLTRVPLAVTYEQIESDLIEALKIQQPLFDGDTQKTWRANKAAVYAFAARFYLYINNYAEAEKYATLSLNEYDGLVDYNSEMGYSSIFPIWPSTYETVDITWKEFTYYRVTNHGGMIAPSTSLTELYDKENDLRYEYHFVEGGPSIFGIFNPTISYMHLGLFSVPSGTTVAETILTKAEALARLNRVSEAMTVVNSLRVKRIKNTATDINLSASSKNEAISKILEERRREMPFSLRWFDMRRINHNEDPNDDQTYSREFYPFDLSTVKTDESLIDYSLTPGSRKYAIPIPETEIIASQGVMEQNNY
ncbi:hypothetical protein PK35_01500 [Tamlana nanhaiensis]|uniref:RagB/SusD family nutrient uptake outer membrane protein n=1 Tax=Neotamlana nanhaiensis TaxID=1382798 RepID=A0A0D7W9R2_9FLAO|nr:RagB/SusD family nutrient uptake outer membrane protein [Tamlana nanhaiensis]KJD34497.1 hypothetical protein PK35_01500 [Tamlana nanhaiensis]